MVGSPEVQLRLAGARKQKPGGGPAVLPGAAAPPRGQPPAGPRPRDGRCPGRGKLPVFRLTLLLCSLLQACLGLDPGQYRSAPAGGEGEGVGVQEREEEADRFRACLRPALSCVCGEEIVLEGGVVRAGSSEAAPALLACPRPRSCGGFPLQRPGRVTNCLDTLVRRCVSRYYAGWLLCEVIHCLVWGVNSLEVDKAGPMVDCTH